MISDTDLLRRNFESLESNQELRILAAKVKFQQLSEITTEILKLKMGLSKFECQLRNYLQVLSGEMELYCKIDIKNNVDTILTKIAEGFTNKNWIIITDNILDIYRAIYEYCK